MLETLLIGFITSGGLGYINYYILKNKDIIRFNDNESDEKKLTLLLFSIINFLIILFFMNWFGYEQTIFIQNLIIAVIFTIIITVALSFAVFPWVINLFKNGINKSRIDENKSGISNLTVKEQLFDEDTARPVFIFDLRTHELLHSGFIGSFNVNPEKDYELEIIPFSEETDLITYEDLQEYSIKNSKDVVVYINADKELLIFLVKNSNSKE